ncbi:MAG TPA: prolyl aminopeptidase [Gaiellaceae bacterium]|nr:prolyl aminopeptidase [Gaiellaceae bacterium]
MDRFATGMLDVGDGHRVYWECCGNPRGLPVLYFHGGPGSGATPGQRRFFDSERHLAVLFDQRGSGRSRPLASEPDADLAVNTTHHLIADAEALREHLGVERWAAILGLSWGSTLGLAYAQAHRDRVAGVVLGLVTTTSRREVEWVTEGVGRIFPEQWHRFAEAVPERLRHLRLVDAYAELLFDPDPAVREHAAAEWCAWEDAHVSLTPGWTPSLRYEDPEFRLRFARLVTHYWRHAAFLEEEQLLRDAPTLDGVPGVLIHGRWDVSSPLETPWRLSRGWATSRLVVLDDAGHGGGDSLTAAITGALRDLTSA